MYNGILSTILYSKFAFADIFYIFLHAIYFFNGGIHMMDMYECWNETLKTLEQEIAPVAFGTWIKTLKPLKMTDNSLTVETFDNFYKKTIEERHSRLIQIALEQTLNKKIDLKIVIPGTQQDEKLNDVISAKQDYDDNEDNLISKYVFESFVVGDSNRMAHAASVAVAEAPGQAYNPLFLYGGVGLGKTHLMHAIAHYILEQNPNTKVRYASCEKFTNELITSIRENKNNEFRNKYRKIDVLLIDDIQFITDKVATQDEFFHTFNTLWLANKQIIISSDRPPKEIQTLTDRLRSRFEGGLIADIKLPDFETRTAILEKKAEIDNLNIPKEVFQFIAQSVKSNIRELEGALNRVIAYSHLANKNVDVPLAEEALKDIINDAGKQELSIKYIQETVASNYGLKADELNSKSRKQPIVAARQIAMYFCRKLLDESLAKVGEKFGGRDHTTVIHALDKISSNIEDDEKFKIQMIELEKKITRQ